MSDEQIIEAYTLNGAGISGLRAVEAAVRADGEKVLARMNREWTSMAVERNALTEQLAAAQAVIAEAHQATAPLPGETSYVDAYYRIASILSQSPTDALQAHDRQVAAKALTDAADAHPLVPGSRFTTSWLRARTASLVPGNPEPTEGETRG